MSKWKNRIIGHDEVAAGQLLANPFNFRIHGLMQRRSVKASMDELGWIRDVVVNQRTGHIVDGHLRVDLALQEGEDTMVPVSYVDLDTNEERIALAMLDPTAAMADTDKATFRELLESINSASDGINEALGQIALANNLNAEEKENIAAEYPIAKKFTEKYDYVLVFCRDEMDYANLCTILNIQREQSYKSKGVGLGRVVKYEDFIELWKSRS